MAMVINIVQNVPTSAPQMPGQLRRTRVAGGEQGGVEPVLDQSTLFQLAEPLDLLVGEAMLASGPAALMRPFAN